MAIAKLFPEMNNLLILQTVQFLVPHVKTALIRNLVSTLAVYIPKIRVSLNSIHDFFCHYKITEE